MSPELFRFCADALDDPTTGVNALRTALPRRVGEPLPPPVRVVNIADDAWVSRGNLEGEATQNEFLLAVRGGLELTLAGDPAQSSQDDTCPVLIQLKGLSADGENALAFNDALRLMRIVRRSILAAFAVHRADPLILDQQIVTLPVQWTQQTLAPKEGAGTVDLVHVIPFLITDTWTLGATT